MHVTLEILTCKAFLLQLPVAQYLEAILGILVRNNPDCLHLWPHSAYEEFPRISENDSQVK
jgi:hypothetical protein